MFEATHFMKTQDLLERGLGAATQRRKVITDNIANADVPNFKRSEVVFESMLKRAIESEKLRRKKPFLQKSLMTVILNFLNLSTTAMQNRKPIWITSQR